MSDRHFPLRAHIYVDHSVLNTLNTQSLLLTPGDGFLKSRKRFLSPSAGATKLITQAWIQRVQSVCVFV